MFFGVTLGSLLVPKRGSWIDFGGIDKIMQKKIWGNSGNSENGGWPDSDLWFVGCPGSKGLLVPGKG